MGRNIGQSLSSIRFHSAASPIQTRRLHCLRCSLRVASIPVLHTLCSLPLGVLSDRFAESGEHYFCVFYVGMKPRFGDEYKVGFLTVSHLLSLLPVRRFCSINYVHCNIDIVNFALVRCYLNFSPVLVVLCASFLHFYNTCLVFWCWCCCLGYRRCCMGCG